MSDTYGRNRQSIADLHEQLTQTFLDQPDVRFNDSNEPFIPASSLLHVITQFSRDQGITLMTKEEEVSLQALLETNESLEVTPDLLMGFVAHATGPSAAQLPPPPPKDESPGASSGDDSSGVYSSSRPASRQASRPASRQRMSRNSSIDSTPANHYREQPTTPKTPKSPFDSRQRSTPLESAAPSSWAKKPVPAFRRRKSDAGLSDNEGSPSTSGLPRRGGSRHRAPSNPVTPGSPSNFVFPNGGSQGVIRHTSHPSLPESFDPYLWEKKRGVSSPPGEIDYSSSIATSVDALAVANGDETDVSDDEGQGLIPDRSTASSLASTDSHERAEALARVNADLNRRIQEQERTLLSRLSQHETELEELQMKLDETKGELTGTKREEKELRLKERNMLTQISTLESEIAKLQRSLENSRSSYSNLQKQYQEQCQESEKYRNALRRKDQDMKEAEETQAQHLIEQDKWTRERDSLEAQLLAFEQELAIARQAQLDLESQKQENLLLKETIDRLRFDLDELRVSSAAAAGGPGSRGTSHSGTVSRTWGQELKERLGHLGDAPATPEMPEEELPADEDQQEDEVIHTYITHKRKVASRANKPVVPVIIQDNKVYADAYTQHEADGFTSGMSIQTDPLPEKSTASFSIQTEAEPRPRLVSALVQTDLTAKEVTSLEDDASSSVSPRSPTPGTSTEPRDHPPPYEGSGYRPDRNSPDNRKVAAQVLKQWHEGLKVPFGPIPGGVSEDAIEEWAALKEELGLECSVIDKIINMSTRTGKRRARSAKAGANGPSALTRLYNFMNRYLVRPPKEKQEAAADSSDDEEGAESVVVRKQPKALGTTAFPLATQVMFGLGVWLMVVAVVTPHAAPLFDVPGVPTYTDRLFWTAYNALSGLGGQGFSDRGAGTLSDGMASEAVWIIAEKLLFGGAITVRRPT